VFGYDWHNAGNVAHDVDVDFDRIAGSESLEWMVSTGDIGSQIVDCFFQFCFDEVVFSPEAHSAFEVVVA